MKRRLRIVAAVVAAVIAWTVAATAGNLVLRQILDGYREAERGMTFSATMMIGRLAVGLVASIAGGVVARLAAGCSSPAPWLAGTVLLAIFVPAHIALWPNFPLAYHLFFLASLVATPWLAARAIARSDR